MIIYVCYADFAWEGCSEPQALFKTEAEAKAWVEEKDIGWGGCTTYKSMVLSE